ncbi:MAG TPA: imidazolonepropionase [Myxococcaceae bacterium]|nr:imidazolonepropionase [Myxococcaceae bacterium]
MGRTFDLLVRNAGTVFTADGADGGNAQQLLGPIPRGAVCILDAHIAWIGAEGDLPRESVTPSTKILDAGGGLVVPGFVDSHTHLVWAGERSHEFALRCAGADYLSISRAGGGIASTVRAVREASDETLVALALPRLHRLLAQGVTTAEVKSGYGLDADSELRMLRVIDLLGARQPIRLLRTFLWLHAMPPGSTDRAGFLARGRKVLREVARAGLARFADAFVEEGAFGQDEVRPFLEEARTLGFGLKLHVDQLRAGRGAEFAASLGALSADHLESIDPQGIAALASARVTAVLIPTATLVLRLLRYAPGRALVDAGVGVAVATNCNPGSAPTENLALAMSLACLQNGLTPPEALLGVTRRGGEALGDTSLGRLRVGGPADLVVLGAPDVDHLVAHVGTSHVQTVVRAGRVVLRSDANACS